MAAGKATFPKGTPPASPAAGNMSIFFGSDGSPYTLTEAGVIVPLHSGCPTSTGTANAQAITSSITSYVAGQRFTFVAGYTNTAAMTLTVNGITPARNVVAWAGPTTPASLSYAGMMVAGGVYTVVDSGTNYVLLNPSAKVGVADGSGADAGVVGEVLRQELLLASHISATSTSTYNVTASPIALTPGDWLISGAVYFEATTSIQFARLGVSKTSVTAYITNFGVAVAGEYTLQASGANLASTNYSIVIPAYRYTVASSLNLYLVARLDYTGANGYISGSFEARRVR